VIADAMAPTLVGALQAGFAEAARRARRVARPVLLSQTIRISALDDPVTFFAGAGRRHAYRAYWEQPTLGVALVGVGAARVIRTAGPDRFREAAALIAEDMATAVVGGERFEAAPGGPVYLGGFAFDPLRPGSPDWHDYPAGLLILPRLLLDTRDGGAALTLSALVEPDADLAAEVTAALRDLGALSAPEAWRDDAPHQPPRILATAELPGAEPWKATVAAAAADVRAGRFEKVVLARELRLWAAEAFDAASVLRRLRTTNPSATIFAIAMSDRCFLGATPELLVRLADREVEAVCLAGSIARGVTEAEEERLARALLASAKDRAEHEVAAVCDDVARAPATPWVVRSESVQHLATPLTGRLAIDACVLDLVERLHPTPAVGGFPRDVALAAIREREGIDRGWYAGPVGWVNRAGEGDFAVAIRSALLADRAATLYAGAGIVADSDPEAEYAETRLKLEPMLAALGMR
jgi:isochorismate synthase